MLLSFVPQVYQGQDGRAEGVSDPSPGEPIAVSAPAGGRLPSNCRDICTLHSTQTLRLPTQYQLTMFTMKISDHTIQLSGFTQ